MKLKLLLITFLLFVISLIVTLNLFFHQSYEAEMASQINQHQLIIANTIAAGISDTFEHFEEELVSFSGLLSYRELDPDGLDSFVKFSLAELQEEIDLDLFILDNEDNVVFATGQQTVLAEDDRLLVDIARRNADKKPYLYDAGSTEGKIKITAPIRREGNILGTVMMFVHIDDVTDKFLSHIQHKEKGYAWVMDVYGTLIYHPEQPSMIGKNIFTSEDYCYTCHVSFEVEKDVLRTTGEGVQTYIAPRGEDKILAFSHTEVPEWIVIVTMPYSQVTASIKNSMKLQSFIVLTIFILTVLAAFVMIIINRQRVKAEARADYADKIREYANELESIVRERTKELSSEKEKLDAVIGSIEAGIAIFDVKNQCVWMNKVLEGWLSDEKRESLSFNHFIKNTGMEKGRYEAVVEDKLIMEVAQLDLGRKKGFFQLAITHFHTPEGESQMLLLIQDITELKMAEEKLIQSDKLAALSRLSAGVAHEIGNPLTSISSYVQILDSMEEKDEFTEKILRVISNNISRIVSIVKQMSSFTKTQKEELAEHQIKELVESTVELVRYDKRTKGIDVRLEVPEDLRPVWVDGNQLVQIFINLILNAVDSMSDKGVLEISAWNDDGTVAVSFKDTGQGIEEENLERIFEPFFTTKETGTGFGLSVSYSIIKSFGGEIDVESVPGEGTTFTVRLPVYEKQQVPADNS